MKRKSASSEKIEKIIAVSRKLFTRNGYEATSVRDILKAADISTGSLYNFFKNKEEILLLVYQEIIDQIYSTSEEVVSEFDNPLMKISVAIALQTVVFLKNTSQQNIYDAAFESHAVNAHMVHRQIQSVTPVLHEADLSFSDKEIEIRVVAMNAAINAVLKRCMLDRSSLEYNLVYSLLIRICLSQFDVPDKEIDSIIRKTKKVIS